MRVLKRLFESGSRERRDCTIPKARIVGKERRKKNSQGCSFSEKSATKVEDCGANLPKKLERLGCWWRKQGQAGQRLVRRGRNSNMGRDKELDRKKHDMRIIRGRGTFRKTHRALRSRVILSVQRHMQHAENERKKSRGRAAPRGAARALNFLNGGKKNDQLRFWA